MGALPNACSLVTLSAVKSFLGPSAAAEKTGKQTAQRRSCAYGAGLASLIVAAAPAGTLEAGMALKAGRPAADVGDGVVEHGSVIYQIDGVAYGVWINIKATFAGGRAGTDRDKQAICALMKTALAKVAHR